MLLSTTEVLDALRRAYPDANLTEDRIRHVVRRREVTPETRFAGRLVWTESDVRALAEALGLAVPEPNMEKAAVADADGHARGVR